MFLIRVKNQFGYFTPNLEIMWIAVSSPASCTSTLPQIYGGISNSFNICGFSRKLFNSSNIRQISHFRRLPTTTTFYCCSCSSQASSPDENFSLQQNQHVNSKTSFWNKWKESSAEMSAKLGKLGLAAVLAYGLFDGVTYTSFFVLAFLGYEKSTGKNPAANLQALLGIVILMWTGNNITRPFRVAGAAALAPVLDRGLRRMQKYFNFPNVVYAFALVVAIFAGSCFTVAGLLILSRWGK